MAPNTVAKLLATPGRIEIERNFMNKSKLPSPGANTRKLQNLRPQWKPGQSGNPAGRPKGARQKLAEAFLEGMLCAYAKGGAKAIEDVMKDEPAKFLSALVAILPKQVEMDGEVKVRVTSAVDSLISKLNALAQRDVEYGQEREAAMKTIELEADPGSASVKRLILDEIGKKA
jgi:hypothetical protein